jgi:hypothetical protein
MELYTLFSLMTEIVEKLNFRNPAYLDLLKMVGGSLLWFGGLMGFMYQRQRKLKVLTINH